MKKTIIHLIKSMTPFFILHLCMVINAQELEPKVTMGKRKLIILTADDKSWESVNKKITRIVSSTAIELKRFDEAINNFKLTLINAERIGSELWEVRANICMANIKFLNEDFKGALHDVEKLNDQKIKWDDLRIKYEIIILLLKISIKENDEKMIIKYTKQGQDIFEIDATHGYLYEELQKLINSL